MQGKPEINDELYRKLIEILQQVYQGLTELDIHIPIYKIARMDLHGEFDSPEFQDLHRYIHWYLEATNNYRKNYWALIQQVQKLFDNEMKLDGSYAPNCKQYNSLKRELPITILQNNPTYWINSYDLYLTEIRKHSDKTTAIHPEPRDGNSMYHTIATKTAELVTAIINAQQQLLPSTAEFIRKLSVEVSTTTKKERKKNDKKVKK